jgi:5'-nucleotidase
VSFRRRGKEMIVLVDVDSTVADLMPEWLRLYNEEWGDKLSSSDITEWDMTKFVHPDCGNKIYSYLLREDLYDNVKPIDGAVEGVQHIRSLGHRVVFVSAGVYAHAKFVWLNKHGFEPGKYAEDFIVAYDKSLIQGDVLIDDKYENVIKFPQDDYKCSILFSQPWNRKYQWVDKVSTWKQFIEYFVEELHR